MKAAASLTLILAVAASPLGARAADTLRIGGFSGLGPVDDVARAKGFLEAEGVRVEFHLGAESSEALMTGFVRGDYDLIQTNADNVIAWADGRGIDGQAHDFVIVMGGLSGLDPKTLIVGPDISGFEDLKGKTLAVDAINTGYAPVLVYMLKEHGLIWKRDYELKSIGGGSMRREALKQGEAAGGFTSLDEELGRLGFRLLADSTDYFIDYARGVTAARRDWADRHRDLLVRYIRGMIRSFDWLLEPANRQEATGIIMAAGGLTADAAGRIYEEFTDPRFGYIPSGAIERSGVERIIQLRGVMGEMSPPLPPPDKYIDERFHRQALESL